MVQRLQTTSDISNLNVEQLRNRVRVIQTRLAADKTLRGNDFQEVIDIYNQWVTHTHDVVDRHQDAPIVEAWKRSSRALKPHEHTLPSKAEWATPGVYSWRVPDGVTEIQTATVGAGGGGGGSSTLGEYDSGPGGGGGSGYVDKRTIAVVPGEILTIIIGQGGTGGEVVYWQPGGAGGAGGASLIKRGNTVIGYADGGQGGAGCWGFAELGGIQSSWRTWGQTGKPAAPGGAGQYAGDEGGHGHVLPKDQINVPPYYYQTMYDHSYPGGNGGGVGGPSVRNQRGGDGLNGFNGAAQQLTRWKGWQWLQGVGAGGGGYAGHGAGMTGGLGGGGGGGGLVGNGGNGGHGYVSIQHIPMAIALPRVSFPTLAANHAAAAEIVNSFRSIVDAFRVHKHEIFDNARNNDVVDDLSFTSAPVLSQALPEIGHTMSLSFMNQLLEVFLSMLSHTHQFYDDF